MARAGLNDGTGRIRPAGRRLPDGAVDKTSILSHENNCRSSITRCPILDVDPFSAHWLYQKMHANLYIKNKLNLLDPEFLRASNICLDRSSYNGPCNKNG